MLVFIFIVSLIIFLLVVLGGEGSSYGNTLNESTKSKFKINDKNYFL